MDLIKKYQRAIFAIIDDYSSIDLSRYNIEYQPVIDTKNHRYQLIRTGWENEEKVHSVVFQIDIIGDKIHVQIDNTEEGVANDLLDFDLTKSQIVLGYFTPEMQRASAFAAAS